MALTPDGLVDLRSLGPKNYTPLLLTRDPFPSIAIPEDFPAFTVDREELLEHFKDTLSTIQSNGSSSISVLKGEYGSGKTHLLKVFKTSVNKYLSSRTPRFFAIYAKSPGKSPPELYYSLIEDLGRAFLEEESKRIVTEYLLKIGDDAWGYLYSKDVKRNLNLKDLDLEEYLKNARTFDLYADVKSKSFGNLSNPDVATAFLLLSHPEYGSLAWRWFVGERLDKATRELFKLADNVDSEDAYSTIISLTQLLHLVGVEFIIFLVDEFEKLVKISRIARGDYEDFFLHYINDNPSKLGIFFAISPKECDVLLDESNAFTRRLAGNVYELRRFNEAQIRELISIYLKSYRTTDFTPELAKTAFPKCDPLLAPFAEDGLEAILKKSKGTVSNVLLLCRRSLDYLLNNQGKFDSINDKLVTEAIEKLGL